MKHSLLNIIMIVWTVGLTCAPALAGQPNVVLSRALHFSAPDGSSITLSPGKYFIEQAGPNELRLTREGSQPGSGTIVHAESLTHEQYELFSPMALTRPQKNDEYLIELLMPGGIRLEAKGSTQAPSPPPQTVLVPQPSPSPEVPPSPPITVPEPSMPAPPLSTTIEQPAPPSIPSAPSAPSTTSSPPLAYQPPSLPSQGRRVMVDKQDTGEDPMFLSVLSPDHVGLTIFEQPALFWFIGNQTDHPVDVMITDENNTHMLLDVRMLPPIKPGIHKVELKDYGIKLQPDTTYQWKVMLQGETQGDALVTSGWIRRVDPPSNLVNLTNSPAMNSAPVEPLVEAGLWYDAFWALSERIQTNSLNATYLEQRASLLEQVGLLQPAELDRSHTTR